MAWDNVQPGDAGLPEQSNLGEVQLDPATEEFNQLKALCSKRNGSMNPWRCLIATSVSFALGVRVTTHVNYVTGRGELRFTIGGWRYRRALTEPELRMAVGFDGENSRFINAAIPPDVVTVKIDLTDGTWQRRPKETRPGGRKTRENNWGRGPRNGEIKAIRAAQLRAWEKYGYLPERRDDGDAA